MKTIHLTLLYFFFFIPLVNAQDPSNNFCKDITSSISIEKLDPSEGEGNLFVIALENSNTLYFDLCYGEFEVLKGVVNEEGTLISIVYRSLENSKSINLRELCKVNTFKNDQIWITAREHQPLSFRDWGDADYVEDVFFPDVNTFILRYKPINNKAYDRLYRITQFGVVEYDCYKTTSKEREAANSNDRILNPKYLTHRPIH